MVAYIGSILIKAGARGLRKYWKCYEAETCDEALYVVTILQKFLNDVKCIEGISTQFKFNFFYFRLKEVHDATMARNGVEIWLHSFEHSVPEINT
jgi:hypothetical protein